MGIFPMLWEPKHSITAGTFLELNGIECTDENLNKFFKDRVDYINVIVDNIYNDEDKHNEIDEWIGDNSHGEVYYYQDLPRNVSYWVSIWCFELPTDAVAFKMKWC